MNIETAKQFGITTLKNTAGLMIVEFTGLPDYLRKSLPNNKIGLYTSTGATYGTALEGVDLLFNGSSNLSKGNYMSVLDNVGFLSCFSAGVDMSNIDSMIANTVTKISPLSEDMTMKLIEGGLMSAGLLTANILDQSTGTNKIFDFIRRPVSTTLKMAY